MNKEEALAKIDELKKYIEELDKPTYKVGDRFIYGLGEYIMAKVNNNKICLISLENGCRWQDSVKVKDPKMITEEEFRVISFSYPFIKI